MNISDLIDFIPGVLELLALIVAAGVGIYIHVSDKLRKPSTEESQSDRIENISNKAIEFSGLNTAALSIFMLALVVQQGIIQFGRQERPIDAIESDIKDRVLVPYIQKRLLEYTSHISKSESNVLEVKGGGGYGQLRDMFLESTSKIEILDLSKGILTTVSTVAKAVALQSDKVPVDHIIVADNVAEACKNSIVRSDTSEFEKRHFRQFWINRDHFDLVAKDLRRLPENLLIRIDGKMLVNFSAQGGQENTLQLWWNIQRSENEKVQEGFVYDRGLQDLLNNLSDRKLSCDAAS